VELKPAPIVGSEKPRAAFRAGREKDKEAKSAVTNTNLRNIDIETPRFERVFQLEDLAHLQQLPRRRGVCRVRGQFSEERNAVVVTTRGSYSLQKSVKESKPRIWRRRPDSKGSNFIGRSNED